jgi:hypothetical protein
MDVITATTGLQLAGINSSYGDTALIPNSVLKDVEKVCAVYTGNDSGDEPTEIVSGADGTFKLVSCTKCKAFH